MPKVYISQTEKTKDAYRRKVKTLIKAKMAEQEIKQKDLAKYLGVTEGAVSQMIANGTLSIIQLLQLDKVLNFNTSDLSKLFGRRIQDV